MRIFHFQESFSSRRHRRASSIYWKVMVVGCLLLVLVPLVLWIYFSVSWIIVFFMAAMSVLYAYLNKDSRVMRQIIRSSGLGARGEELVEEQLQGQFGDEYVYIRNYEVPNSKIGDIDGILIGPKGLIVVEIKNWRGQFKIACGEVYKNLGSDLFKLFRSPFKQVGTQVKDLDTRFKQHDIVVRIRPLVVIVSGNFRINGKTGIYIVRANELADFVKHLPDEPEASKHLEDIFRVMQISLNQGTEIAEDKIQ